LLTGQIIDIVSKFRKSRKLRKVQIAVRSRCKPNPKSVTDASLHSGDPKRDTVRHIFTNAAASIDEQPRSHCLN